MLLFFESSASKQCNAPCWPIYTIEAKPSQWSYTTLRVLTWSRTPHCVPLTDPLSQTGVQPLSLESAACVRADVRIPPAASQLCLRYRNDPALSYALLHPPSECVCVCERVSVYVCGGRGVITGRPQPSVEFKSTCFRATFSCKNAPIHLVCRF